MRIKVREKKSIKDPILFQTIEIGKGEEDPPFFGGRLSPGSLAWNTRKGL